MPNIDIETPIAETGRNSTAVGDRDPAGAQTGARFPALTACEMRQVDSPDLDPVPGQQLRILRRMGVPVTPDPPPADLMVDAVLRYGLHGDPAGRAADLITWANTQPAPVLSLDVPPLFASASVIPVPGSAARVPGGANPGAGVRGNGRAGTEEPA